jgi:hypothetical protein
LVVQSPSDLSSPIFVDLEFCYEDPTQADQLV